MNKSSSNATLRTINQLLREVEIVQDACSHNKSKTQNGDKKLDDFQQAKLDLADALGRLKDDIKIHKGMQDRMGRNQEEIRLKHQIEKDLDRTKEIHVRLEEAFKADDARYQKKKKDALSEEEIESRRELVGLLKQDLDYVDNDFKPKAQQESGGFQLARQARERRRKQRENGSIGGKNSGGGDDAGAANEPIPLTPAQQQFIQESIQKDKELDTKLDMIYQGVKQLGQIASDINTELDKQSYMLDEVEQKMDNVTHKIESRNQQMQKILDSTGGAQRWCPVIILLVIFLALMGYVYNLATK